MRILRVGLVVAALAMATMAGAVVTSGTHSLNATQGVSSDSVALKTTMSYVGMNSHEVSQALYATAYFYDEFDNFLGVVNVNVPGWYVNTFCTTSPWVVNRNINVNYSVFWGLAPAGTDYIKYQYQMRSTGRAFNPASTYTVPMVRSAYMYLY